MLAYVQPENFNGARVGRTQSFQNLDRCSLAGAVGPEHAENLAPRHLEADPVDRLDVAVLLLEVRHADDGRTGLRHLTPELCGSTGIPAVPDIVTAYAPGACLPNEDPG